MIILPMTGVGTALSVHINYPLSWSLAISLLLAFIPNAQSQTESLIPAAPTLAASSYILEDADSGKILAEHNADEHLEPASLTKIMTVYVAFREIKNDHLAMTDQATISKKARQMGGSRMYIEVNSQVSIHDLLKGIIVQSGNDASVALAEHIAGDEATFAELMNQQAKRLGMSNSSFRNSTGWPDPEHYTTARDMATLTRALIDEYPEYYAWHGIKELTYNNIKQHNRNNLLWRDPSVDGVKTGHTEAAGYCLVASAKRDEMRLVSVVMGTKSTSARANQTQTLLNYGFRFFETYRLYKPDEALTEVRVWKGESKKLALGLPDYLYVTIPRNRYKDLEAAVDVDQKVIAPVEYGQSLGAVNVSLSGNIIATQPLVALKAVPKGNLFRRMYDEALLLME